MIPEQQPILPADVAMRPVKSSNISRVGYDAASGALYVDFGKVERPSVYRYSGFTPDQLQAFLEAESLGAYFQRVIKPKFTGVKVISPAPVV